MINAVKVKTYKMVIRFDTPKQNDNQTDWLLSLTNCTQVLRNHCSMFMFRALRQGNGAINVKHDTVYRSTSRSLDFAVKKL